MCFLKNRLILKKFPNADNLSQLNYGIEMNMTNKLLILYSF